MKYAAFLLIAICMASFADEQTYGSATVKQFESNHDGDTFTVTFKSWPAIIGDHIEIRVAGVDTPEINGKCDYEKQLALKAKEFTAQMLTSGQPIVLKGMARDKYFRIVATVMVGKKNLADELIKANLGYPYNGGTKKSWCDSVPPVKSL